MIPIVGIVGPGGAGGTFLDWSLHYLSGNKDVIFVLVDRGDDAIINPRLTYPVINNPLQQNGTAHNHKKTHPTFESIGKCVECYNKMVDSGANLYSMYIVPKLPNQSLDTTLFGDVKFVTYVIEESNKYQLIDRQYDKIFNHPTDAIAALVLGPNTRKKIFSALDLSFSNGIIHNSYSLTFDDMLHRLDNHIRAIFKFISVDIVEDKYEHWLSVYKQWQTINHVLFFDHLEYLIECVKLGIDHDLTKYDMTLVRECILIRSLADRNIFIKYDEHAEMPKNTRDWHHLITQK